jgi:hypothetical protein
VEKLFSGLKKMLFSLPGQGLMSAVLLISSVFAMFSTLPPLFTYTSEGRERGVTVLFFGLVFTMLFMGTGGLIFYLVLIFFTTVVLGEFINSKFSFAKTLTVSTAVIVGTYLAVLILYTLFTPSNPKDVLVTNVSTGISSMELVYPDLFKDLIKESGMTKAEIIVSVATLVPSYVFIAVVIFLFFNMIIVARFHEHLRNFFTVQNLKGFKIPDIFIWPALVFSALFLYANSSYNKDFYISAIAAFLFKGIMVFYFLQGLGIVFLFLQHNIKTVFFRNLVLSMMVLFAYVFVTAVGFFDTWFDFRKFLKKGEEL